MLRKVAKWPFSLSLSHTHTPESRERIRTQDWVHLEKVSGVRTNASALYALYQRCITAGLQYPHLEACGLANLRAGLRTQAHKAPLHVHKPPSLESNLGHEQHSDLEDLKNDPRVDARTRKDGYCCEAWTKTIKDAQCKQHTLIVEDEKGNHQH